MTSEKFSQTFYCLSDKKRALAWKVKGDGNTIESRYVTDEMKDNPNRKHWLFEFLGEQCRDITNIHPVFLEWFGQIYVFEGYHQPRILTNNES